jgi:TolB protein
VDAQGRNRYRLITDADSDAYNTIYDVVWSPNGERLAFIGGRSGEEDVYLADADGRNPRNLTRRGIGYKNLVWSADSRYLTVENSHLNEDIYRLNPDTGAVKNLTAHAGRDIRAFWSPDGEQMAFLSTRHGDTLSSAQFDLYLVNADGRNLRRLTDDFPASSMWVARWSPDGRKIAFGSWSWSGGADIYLIDVNSRMVRNFTSDSDTESAPVWSPDGRWLAYEARASGSNWVINLVNADGENRRQLTSEAYTNRRPVWSPDGQTLLFHSNRNRSWSIYLLSDLSSEQPLMRRLTGGRGIDFWPVWRP